MSSSRSATVPFVTVPSATRNDRTIPKEKCICSKCGNLSVEIVDTTHSGCVGYSSQTQFTEAQMEQTRTAAKPEGLYGVLEGPRKCADGTGFFHFEEGFWIRPDELQELIEANAIDERERREQHSANFQTRLAAYRERRSNYRVFNQEMSCWTNGLSVPLSEEVVESLRIFDTSQKKWVDGFGEEINLDLDIGGWVKEEDGDTLVLNIQDEVWEILDPLDVAIANSDKMLREMHVAIPADV